MNRRLKGILMSMLLLLAVVLVGCGDPYANVYVEYEGASSVEIVLGETPDNTISVVSSIKKFVTGMSDLMFFSPDRTVVKIEETTTLGNGKTRIKIVGLKPGTVLLKAQTLEGSKSAFLTVNVLQPLKSFAINSSVKPYLMRNSSISIDPLDYVDILPIDTTEKNIDIQVKNLDILSQKGIVFENNEITVPADFDERTITFIFSAYKEVNGTHQIREDIESKEISFAVISSIDKDSMVLYAEGNDGTNASISSINLLSNSVDFSHKKFFVEVSSEDFELESAEEFVSLNIESPSSLVIVSNVYTEKLDGFRRIYFTLQSTKRNGTAILTASLSFNNINLEISKELTVVVQVVAERIEVNNKTSFADGEYVSTYTKFSSINGTPVNFLVYPTDCASKYSVVRIDYQEIPDLIALSTVMGNQIIPPIEMTEQEKIIGRRIDSGVVLFETYFEIASGTTVYVKGIAESDEIFFLNAYLALNSTYSANGIESEIPLPIYYSIPIQIVKGATEISMPTDNIVCLLGINGETAGQEKEYTFVTDPVDAYTSDFTIYSSSTIASFVKLENKTFKLVPHKVGTGSFIILLGNGAQKEFTFEIVSNLRTDTLVLDVENVDAIGYKNTDSSVIQFAIKFGMSAFLLPSFEPANASISSISFGSSNGEVIQTNSNSGLIFGKGIGGQTQKVIISAIIYYRYASLDEEGNLVVTDQHVTKTMTGECYVPLKSFSMSKSRVQLYDYNSVGYYNKAMSEELLLPVFSPVNATYRNFTATDQGVSTFDQSKFLISFSNSNYHLSYKDSTDFSDESKEIIFDMEKHNNKPIIYSEYVRYNYATNVIEANVKSGYLPTASSIIFTVKEFDSEFSYSIDFAPLLQTKVDTITLKNCSESEEIYLDANRCTFQIIADAEPLEAFNTNLKYDFFPPTGGGATANVTVNDDGLVSLVLSGGVTAGRGFIRVSAEDSYVSSTEPTRFVDIPVRVADGSIGNPYTLRTANDVLNIKGEGLKKFYVLESNINLGNVSWSPLGIFTGGIIGNGVYTISGIKLDNSSIIAAKELMQNDIDVRTDPYNNLQTTPRVRVGLFTKILGVKSGDVYQSGFIRNVNFSGIIDITNNDSNLLLDIGLIAAQNYGEISCSTVSLTSASVSVATAVIDAYTWTRVGGVVGLNAGLINNRTIENKISSKIGVQMLNENIFNVCGTNVIFGMLVGQNGEKGVSSIPAMAGNIDWLKEINAFEEQYVTAIASAKVFSSLTYAFGGIAGVNLLNSIVSGVIVKGNIIGCNNIGGAIGINQGEAINIVSSVRVSALSGGTNIGGLIGQNTGSLESSSVQVFDEDMADSEIVFGYRNVGGVIGLMTAGNVQEVFFVSYQNSQSKFNVKIYGTGDECVGGFVGKIEGGNLTKVFSHATVEGNVNSIGSLIGKISNTIVPVIIQDFYSKSNVNIDGDSSVQIVGSQEGIWGSSSINYGYSFYPLASSITPITYYGENVYFGNENTLANFDLLNNSGNWANSISAGRAILKFNDVEINVDPPTDISVTAEKNVLLPTDGGTELVVYTYYYQAVDTSLQTYLTSSNTFLFSDYLTASYVGNNPLGISYKIINHNTDILAFQNDASVKVLKTGLAKISVVSKFNSGNYKEFYIFVVNAAEKLDVFVGSDFSSRIGNNVTLVIKRNETRKLYAQLSCPNVNVNDGNANISVEIIKNNFPSLVATETSEVKPSIAFSYANGFFTITGLTAQSSGSFELQSQIKLQINNKTYLTSLVDAVKNFHHRVNIGASSISTSISNISTVPYYKNIIDFSVATDDNAESVSVEVSKIENGVTKILTAEEFSTYFKSFSSFNVSNGKILPVLTSVLDEGIFQNICTGKFELELQESKKFIETQTIFVVKFVASNNVIKTVQITINPQPVLDINISQFNKLSDSNMSSERSIIITPGITAAFTMVISPEYASFDYLDIVSNNDSSINIALVVEGITDGQNPILISGGIRLPRNLVKSLVQTYGFVKIGMLCSSSVPDLSIVSVKVQTIKAGEEPFEKIVSFTARNSVKAKLTLDAQKENGTYIVCQGIEYLLNLQVTGNPDTIEFVSNPSYIISERDGSYYLRVLTQEALSKQSITVNISKVVEKVTYTNDDTININIVKAVVLSAPVGDLDYSKKVIRVAKGNSFDLFADFVYQNSILYNLIDSNLTIAVDDLDTIAMTNAVWEYSPESEENWKILGVTDIYEDSFKAIANRLTILEDDIEFKFRMTIYVEYDISGNASMPKIVTSETEAIENQTIVTTKSTEFTFEVFVNTTMSNAIPIRTENDLMNMHEGLNYILLNDITLTDTNFEPITANIASLNGNNKKIILPSTINIGGETNIEFALFKEIAEGTIVQNLTVAIASNTAIVVSNEISYSSVSFACLAVRNFGVITNCEAKSLHNSNYDIIQTNEPYRIYLEANTSNNTIVTSGLVCTNGATGTITNSRVTLSILAPKSVAGFVNNNLGKISSSYVKGVSMTNYDATGFNLSGFVNTNGSTGEIFSSYVEGEISAQYINGEYSLATMESTLQKVESINGNASSFIFENSGKVLDCYANIKTVAKNYASGFVYENKQGATITNCFSLSVMQSNNFAATAFVGRNEVNKILNDGIISNSAYYKDTAINDSIYTNEGISGLISLKKVDFTNRNHSFFSTFLISIDSEKTKGIWFIPSGGFERDFRYTSGVSMIFYAGLPSLVSPNIISQSEYDLYSYEENALGSYEYCYELVSGEPLGTVYNPYIIFDRISFNENLTLNADSLNKVNKNYRLVADIDFEENNILTYKIAFNGNLEGNGMKISNIVLENEQTLASAGFFASIGDKSSGRGSVKNLTLGITKIYMPNTTVVGGLAGTFYGGNIGNVSIVSGTGDANIIGKNIVGGMIGLAEIIKDTKIFNITTDIPVVALKQRMASSFVVTDSYNLRDQLSVFSYAGGVFGVINNSTLNNIKISDLITKTSTYVIADNVGIIAGYIGEKLTLTNLTFTGNSSSFVRASRTAGGIVGELVGGSIINARMTGLSNATNFIDTTSAWPFYAGGVAGVVRGGTISNCNNDIKISIDSNSSNSKKTVVGGVAGLLNTQIDASKNSLNQTIYTFKQSGLIENCSNNALISAEIISGGIVGSTLNLVSATVTNKTFIELTKTRFNLDYNVKISFCTNNAKISSAQNQQDDSSVGGIVGMTCEETEIDYCTNYGEIYCLGTKNSIAGGIVGHVKSSEINNTNNLTGDVVTSDGTNLTNSLLTKVYKCNNTGNITAKTLVNGQDLAAGGIVGQINSEKTETPALMSIEMSYNTGAIKIEGYTSNSAYGGIGGIVGETTLNCGKVFICQTYNAGTLNNTNTMDRGDTPAKVKIGGISGRGGLMFASEELADNETAQSFFLASTGLLPVGSALVGEVTWATGLSSANMKQKSSYIVENEDGWNFSTVWVLEDDSIIYPTLYSSYENKNFYYDNNNYTLKTRNDTQLSSNITVPAEINGCVVKSFIVTDYNLIGTINFAISSSLVAVLFEEPNCYANLLSTDAGLPNFTNNINATNLQNIYVPDLFGTFASNRIKLEAKGWESSKVLFYSEALVFSSDGFIGAKSGLTSLTAIILPTKINGNLMTKISTDAFKGFLNLTTIVLTEKTTILGTSSFEDCSSLVSIYIPSSVLTINSFAFKDCSTLECLTFPKNITIISDYVLSGCTALTSVVFINGITNIGNSAFASCSSLPVVTLPETTTSIGANAFSSCSGLTSFTIPASITTIGANAFNNSINIATLLVQSKNVVSDIAEASSYGNLYNYATRVYFLDSLSPSPAGSYLTTNFTLQGSSDIGGYKLWLRNA